MKHVATTSVLLLIALAILLSFYLVGGWAEHKIETTKWSGR